MIRDGEDPSSIVAFTFTEKAATELKDRIYDYTGRLMGADYLGRLGPLFVGTIHAFCFQLLQSTALSWWRRGVVFERSRSPWQRVDSC